MKQVFAEFGQLAGAEQRRIVDDIGRVAFGVAVLPGVGVEHKLRQRAVQAGNRTFHQAEAGAGECGGGFKIQAQFFA